MKCLSNMILCALGLLLTACDVHEWPEPDDRQPLHIDISFDETEMTPWEHIYDDENGTVVEQNLGTPYDLRNQSGKIRYIVRAFPVTRSQQTARNYVQEFVFVKDIADGYNHRAVVDLAPGDYNIMVWSDMVESDGRTPYYDATDFSSIKLAGDTHTGSTNFCDAFRGSSMASLTADIVEHTPTTIDVAMQRPLAKFEFVANDMAEFIEKEAARAEANKNAAGEPTAEDEADSRVNLGDYQVVFYYVGYMPDKYSMFSDKPVDSATGIMFSSSLKAISNSEASLGFDYVLVNGNATAVSIRVAIYDNDGNQLSLTDAIEVPLKRSRHTIVRGKFLTAKAQSGLNINPDYDGEYNLVFKKPRK